MADDEIIEPPKAEKPKAKDTGLAESLKRLKSSAKAAGLRPFEVMLGAYAKQGADILDGFLGALEEGEKKKAARKRKKTP